MAIQIVRIAIKYRKCGPYIEVNARHLGSFSQASSADLSDHHRTFLVKNRVSSHYECHGLHFNFPTDVDRTIGANEVGRPSEPQRSDSFLPSFEMNASLSIVGIHILK